MPAWLKLDSTANLWPAVFNSRATSIFRLEFNFSHMINVDLLDRAIKQVLPDFPFFQVHARPGLFWYMLVRRSDFPSIETDVVNPCMNPKIIGKGRWPFRIRVWNQRIAFEFSHLLTDGVGALTFCKALVEQYSLLYEGSVDLYTRQKVDEETSLWEDPSLKLAKENSPIPPTIYPAIHFPHSLGKPGEYQVLHAFCSSKAILALCKEKGLSLTEYCTAVLISVMQDHAFDWLKNKIIRVLAPIRIIIPVNLRNLFNVPTLRNFYAFTYPEIDPRMGVHSFEEISSTVMYTMRRQLQPNHLLQQLSQNVNEGRALYRRIVPLFIKNIVIAIVYGFRGNRLYSLSLSNLGRVDLGPASQRNIVNCSFIAPPNPVQKTNVNIISVHDELCITFSSLCSNTSFQRDVLRYFSKQGISFVIASNKEQLERVL